MQSHPMDFSRIEMSDLSADMVAMENFDEDEFDQYLPASGHVPQCSAPSRPLTAGPFSAASCMAAGSYRLSVAAPTLAASGVLQRMAGTQAALSPPGRAPTDGLDPAYHSGSNDTDTSSPPSTDGGRLASQHYHQRETKYSYEMDVARYGYHDGEGGLACYPQPANPAYYSLQSLQAGAPPTTAPSYHCMQPAASAARQVYVGPMVNAGGQWSKYSRL